MSSVDKIGFAEIEAKKRRERILQLKRKAEGKSDETESEEKQTDDTRSPQVDDNSVNDIAEDETENESPSSNLKDLDLNLNELGSRKIDWDLKRTIERKLEVLQERTNEAIAELIRDNLVDDI